MNSILNTTVSCVPNYYSKDPKEVNLLTWLQSGKYRQRIEQLRNTTDKAVRKRIKSSLPAITPSGLFSRVDEQHLISHSGFLQFDIDLQDNTHIQNYSSLRTAISAIDNVAYCGLSASGNGWWGLVPIAHTEHHAAHWQYLYSAFLRFHIRIDDAPKSVCSLRGYSYDEGAYFNHEAVTLEQYIAAPVVSTSTVSSTTENAQKVEELLSVIEQRGVDVTSSYQAWFYIGCSFASTFGEEGRGYYHRASAQHPQYTVANTNYQYTQCLRFVAQQGGEAGIGYFVKACMGK